MRTLAFCLAAAALFVTPALVGCGSSSSPSSSSSAASSGGAESTGPLHGTYVATSAGPLAEMTFLDASRVDVSYSSCAGGAACTRADSYSLDTATGILTLTDSQTNEVSKLSFTALAGSGLEAQALHPLDGNSLLGSSDAGLVSSMMALITNFAAGLVGGPKQNLQQTDDDPNPPKANQANTPDSPYDCSGGVCIYDDSSVWQDEKANDILSIQ